MNAARAGKKALGMFTISDHILTGEELPAMDRQVSFNEMMEVALEIA
jgi:purine-nucleoside phosphorylase